MMGIHQHWGGGGGYSIAITTLVTAVWANDQKYISGKGKNVPISSDITNCRKRRAGGCNDTYSFPVEDVSGTPGYREGWGSINAGYLDDAAVKVIRLYGRIQSVRLPLTGISYLQSSGCLSYYIVICACYLFRTQTYACSVILEIKFNQTRGGA